MYYGRYLAIVKPINECESARRLRRDLNHLSKQEVTAVKGNYLRNRWVQPGSLWVRDTSGGIWLPDQSRECQRAVTVQRRPPDRSMTVAVLLRPLPARHDQRAIPSCPTGALPDQSRDREGADHSHPR